MSLPLALPRAASAARTFAVRLTLLVALAAVTAPALQAQGWLQKAKDKARQAADDAKRAAQSTPADKPAASATSAAPSSSGAAPAATNAGNDFTPGTRVILATDFARDEIGDFPRSFRLKSGNMDVADMSGTRYLRVTSYGEFVIPLPETLPPRFTMEFDLSSGRISFQEIWFTPNDDAAVKHVAVKQDEGGVFGPDDYRVVASVPAVVDRAIVPVKIMADGDYVKVYMNGVRVANAPNANLGRSRVVRFKVYTDEGVPTRIGHIRIAAGGKDLYQALETDGHVTAEGILFDSNSDHIRAESAPALKTIGDMLVAHPDLRLSIEGHTDNVGGAAANLALSDKRAAAVKAYLATTFGVDPARLASKGYGATKPTASNDTPDGRARNRRVELVKVD